MYLNQIRAIPIKIFMLLHKVHVQVTKHFNMKEERKTVFLGLTDVESVTNMNERPNPSPRRIPTGLTC